MIEAAVEESSNGLAGLEAMTEREHKIMRHVCNAETNRTIADELSLSERTIKNYISTIYRKLSMNEDEDLVGRLKATSMYVDRYGFGFIQGVSKPSTPPTPTEERILSFRSKGYKNKRIAEELNLVEKSVKNYLTKVYSKFQIPEGVDKGVRAVVIYKKFFVDFYNPANNNHSPPIDPNPTS